jgi:transposase
LLREHQDAIRRLAEVPGLGVDSAQQIIAEVGAKATMFASAKNLVSWVGACPGEEESADVNRSKRSPKGNRQMRALSIRLPMLLSNTKGASLRLSIVVWCYASDTTKPSERLHIACVS